MGVGKEPLVASKTTVLKRIWAGVKIALGVALKAQEKHLIRVKELDKLSEAVKIVDEAITDAQPKKPQP